MHAYRKLSCLVIASLFLTGCKREEAIVTYDAPKPPPQPSTLPATPSEVKPAEIPGMTYTAPGGWQPVQPHQFEAARFDPGAGDGKTFFSIAVLGPQFDLQQNLQRWAGQVGADVSSADAKAKVVKPISLAGASADSLDVAGPKGRSLIAISRRPDATFIFKMSGAADKVEAARPGYEGFLQSIHFESSAPPSPVAAAPAPAATGLPFTFTAPPDWQPDSRPNQFRVLSWTTNGGKVEVFATGPLTAATFDLASNLERWRSQVGLTGAASAADTKATDVRVGDQAGTMVDFTGPGASPKRLIVAYAGKDDLWFFKIQGPADAVAQQKAAFENFLASLKFKSPA